MTPDQPGEGAAVGALRPRPGAWARGASTNGASHTDLATMGFVGLRNRGQVPCIVTIHGENTNNIN